MDALLNALACERLLPESALDVVQDARVRGDAPIQVVLEPEVRLPKPVTQVLRKDPA